MIINQYHPNEFNLKWNKLWLIKQTKRGASEILAFENSLYCKHYFCPTHKKNYYVSKYEFNIIIQGISVWNEGICLFTYLKQQN